jgi:ABC-type Fe3+/spermidine/putrescine transport system ATPase subunit/ABC-type sulfate transport system permease component
VTHRPTRSPLTWLGGLLALYLLVPIVAFVIRLAGSNERGFDTPGLWDAVRVSVESATISTALIAVFGIPMAYWLAHSRGPVAKSVGVLVQLPLALPPIMSGIVLIYLVGPYTRLGELFNGGLTDSVTGIVIAQTFVSAPFLIISARSAFELVDPALDGMAAALGRGPLARFFLVSLRAAGPGIRAGVPLTWLRGLGEYGATVLLAYHPYSLPVYVFVQFSSTGIPDTQAPTALALAIAVVVIALNQTRWPSRLRRVRQVPSPRSPGPRPPTTVAFDLDTRVGLFRLRLRHRATNHRVAILGPSGSGKSMTLRGIAGFLGPGAGPVEYGDEPVTHVLVERRHIGYVPQTLSLMPGRTVWQQLMFAPDADPHLAAWWLKTLHLDGLEDRLPHQLSGGQRQRVSLAQALTHQPRMVLLDEPFSALDAPVRDELRRELRRLQIDMGLSTVLVTHDPEEAALLADEILVIDNGQLLQAGPRAEVYQRPASPQVARLLGIQNMYNGTVIGPGELTTAGTPITADTAGLAPATAVGWCIRPEHVRIDARGRYQGTITDFADVGTATTFTVRLADGLELNARSTNALDLAVGASYSVDLDPLAIKLWAETAPDPTSASVDRATIFT